MINLNFDKLDKLIYIFKFLYNNLIIVKEGICGNLIKHFRN